MGSPAALSATLLTLKARRYRQKGGAWTAVVKAPCARDRTLVQAGTVQGGGAASRLRVTWACSYGRAPERTSPSPTKALLVPSDHADAQRPVKRALSDAGPPMLQPVRAHGLGALTLLHPELMASRLHICSKKACWHNSTQENTPRASKYDPRFGNIIPGGGSPLHKEESCHWGFIIATRRLSGVITMLLIF